MEEIWKSIDGHEGIEVSNLGNVRRKEKVVISHKGSTVYKRVIPAKQIKLTPKEGRYLHADIDNENSSRMVKSDCLAYFLDNGYQLGRGKVHSRSTSGQIWVTDGKSSYLIKPEELDSYLNIGFYKGRIIKNEDTHKVSSTLTSPTEVS